MYKTEKRGEKKVQPAIFLGSASADSINCAWKIFRKKKNSRKVQKSKLEFAAHQQLFP